MDYIIKEATADDAPALLTYLQTVGGESDYLLLDERGVGLTEEEERRILTHIAASAHSTMQIAVEGGEIIGLVGLQGNDRGRVSHRGRIATSVRRDYWGQGIGRTLMIAVIEYAKSAGLEVLELEVRSDNERAKRLYEGLGFKRYGTFPKFMKVKGIDYDCDCMTLDLSE